ncbi:MAG TPA: cytochrome c biogenesis protein CcsA, partial [Chitinivibrionales bacterium]
SDTLRATSALLWANIASTFAVGDQDAFDKASEKLAAFIATTWPGALSAKDPGIELFYNRFDLFSAAKIFYGIGLLFLALYMPLRLRGLYGTAAAILVAGGIVHTLGMVLRLIIMERPPVTNMYETFIFVGWMAVVLGGVTEFFQKHGWGLAIAALSGFSLLHIAGKFGLEGDTMGMLAAVLNNNFWLTSHVITIACGYAGCIAAGLLSHIALVRGVFFRRTFPTPDSLDLCVYGILAFGLTFTVIGTVLGGLWADQAWGRFWGWDPKENGALVIILWCAFLFHMRRTNWLGRQGFAAGCVIGVSLVLCAWLGVNLLGIGMHAYGFTSTGARVLFSVLGFEAAFLISIGIAGILKTARKKRNGPAVVLPHS